MGHLQDGGVHGVAAGAQGVVHHAYHAAQRAQHHVVGVKVVGVHRIVDDGGVLLVGQYDHHQVLLRVDDGQGARPALVADGGVGGLGAEIAGAAQLRLAVPAQAPGGIVHALGLDELVDGIGGEEPVPSVAAGQHDAGQLGQILRVGEEPGVAGDALHGVVGLLVVDLAPYGVGADVAEADPLPVLVLAPGVALELRGGGLLFGKAVLQRIVGHVGEAHGVPEGLLQEFIQPLAHDLLHDEAEEHIVHIGVDGLRARLIGQRRGQDLLQRGLPVLREQRVIHGGVRLLGGLVEFVVVVLRVGVEAGLVHENVPDPELGFPLEDIFLLRVGGPLFEDGPARVVKGGEEIGDMGVQVDLLPVHQILNGVVHRVHLGVGRQVVQGVGGDGDIVIVARLNAGSVRIIAVGGAPRRADHQPAVLHHGELGAGEAVLHLRLNEVANQPDDVLVHPHVGGRAGKNHRVRHVNGHGVGQAGGGDVGHLDGIRAVQGQLGDVDLPGLPRGHGRGVNLRVVHEQPEAGHPRRGGDVQLPLAGKHGEAVEAVHCQGVVHIVLPVREGRRPLPVPVRQLRLADSVHYGSNFVAPITGRGPFRRRRSRDGDRQRDCEKHCHESLMYLLHVLLSFSVFLFPLGTPV